MPTTADLHAAYLHQAHAPFDPREIRLSEVGQCSRRQTLRILGYPADTPTDKQLSIFDTGHRIEDFVYQLWAARYPRRVLRQIQVKTPYGTGHIDLWIPPERKIVEVKSTTRARIADLPLDSHVDQLHMYQYYWGAKRHAGLELAYVVKETGEILPFQIPYDVTRARQLIANLIAVQGAVAMTREPLPVPAEYTAFSYPCSWGAERCAFWTHCWGPDVVAPEGKTQEVVATAAPLTPDLAQYHTLRQRRSALLAQADTLKEHIEVLEEGFERFLTDQGATVLTAGVFRLRRTVVPGRVTYDARAAVDAGVVTETALAPFKKTGAGYTRWTVSQKRTQPQET